jgi:hypothetical protein
MKSIGTERNACIQLLNNELASPFNLGKGHAQGDSSSPILDNLAPQIQIFSIEFDEVPSNPSLVETLAAPNFYKG